MKQETAARRQGAGPPRQASRLINAKPPRVGLLEDHPIVRSGVRQMIELELGWKVVLEAGSVAEFMRGFQPNSLDLLVSDLSLPDRDALVFLGQLRELDPGLDVVVFSMHDAPVYQSRVAEIGGLDLVSKRAAPSELIDRLRHHSLGGSSPAASDEVGADDDPLLHLLTPREREVLLLLARGHSVARVARALGCATKTVYIHRANILQKLKCDGTSGLMRLSMERGWA